MAKLAEKVVIVKVESNDYSKALSRALNLVGGISSLPKGKPIILKPNFVAPRDGLTGAVTDFELVKSVAHFVQDSGACPAIVETPGMEYVPESVYDFLGLEEFAKNSGIELYSGRENLVTVRIPNGKALHSIKVAKILTEAPIIDIPKFKAHPLTKLSFGMKNLMGALPPAQRTRMHVNGIHQSIVDINKVLKPILTVVDANIAMQGDSVYGERVDLGLLIVGTNTLAVDMACCRIVGVQPEQIKHIQLAMAEQKIGDIQLLGDIPKEPFKFCLPKKGTMYGVASRLMYVADVPFLPVFGMPFNRFLYSTGVFGTRPYIVNAKCTKCGKCSRVCAINGAITLNPSPKIDYKKCIRCLRCVDVCSENALTVKGLTKPPNTRQISEP